MCFLKKRTSHKNKAQESHCTKQQLLYNVLTEDGGHFSLPRKVLLLIDFLFARIFTLFCNARAK